MNQSKKPLKIYSDNKSNKAKKFVNLSKAYEVSLDKMDELQMNFGNLDAMVLLGKKYKEKIQLVSMLDVISKEIQE